MGKALQWDTDRIGHEWDSQQVDERLKNVLRIIGMKFDGFRITCLIRTEAENEGIEEIAKNRGVAGPAKKSKHLLLDPDRMCRAVDGNPPWSKMNDNPENWRRKVKDYVDTRFRGLFVEIRDHGTAPHVHIEIDLLSKFEVELL